MLSILQKFSFENCQAKTLKARLRFLLNGCQLLASARAAVNGSNGRSATFPTSLANVRFPGIDRAGWMTGMGAKPPNRGKLAACSTSPPQMPKIHRRLHVVDEQLRLPRAEISPIPGANLARGMAKNLVRQLIADIAGPQHLPK